MALYELAKSSIVALSPTTFGAEQMYERRNLQPLLRDNIEVIAPDTKIILITHEPQPRKEALLF